MSAFLTLENVTRSYGKGAEQTHALAGVDLSIDLGHSLGIVGESGAGKSTILKLLTGLDKPTSGKVVYQGKDLAHSDRALMREFRRQVQVVFQDPRSSLNPRMTVESIVSEPLNSLRIPGSRRERVREVIRWVGLDEQALSKYPAQFSGGQRQRIAIARALAPAPQVLVADEPVSALDVSVRSHIIDLLKDLTHTLGLTLVMVSHDMAIVGQLCEKTAVIRDGRIEEYGSTTEVLTAPQAAYTRKLIDAVPRLPEA